MIRTLAIGGFALATLFTGSAMAADLMSPAPMATVAPTNWTGFYAGVLGGVGAANPTFDISPVGGGAPVASIDVTGNGFVGGARIGYDTDLSGFVVGALADISATSLGAEVSATSGATTIDAKSKLQWLGTIQAKLGVPVTDDLLLYAHGGFAYGHSTQDVNLAGLGGGAPTASFDETRTGWVLGAGAEVALADNLTLTTEYSFVDLGKATIATVGPANIVEGDTYHTVTAGLNFRF